MLGQKMSEPLTSGEIEDVLSSIRRLVSDDLRPAAPRAVEAPRPAGDKLILTPALRVVSEQAEPAGIEQVVASLGAAVQRDEEWEQEAGDVPPIPQDWTAPAATPAEPEPAPEIIATADPEPLPGWAQQAEEAEAPMIEVAGTIEPDQAWADATEARVIAELEGYEEDAPATDPSGGIFAADDPLSYDEQVLRDMVREIIREELQGGLGERITRNIRKLVRAEIARALATQGME